MPSTNISINLFILFSSLQWNSGIWQSKMFKGNQDVLIPNTLDTKPFYFLAGKSYEAAAVRSWTLKQYVFGVGIVLGGGIKVFMGLR